LHKKNTELEKSNNKTKDKKSFFGKIRQRFRIVIQSEHDFQEKRNYTISPAMLITFLFIIILFVIAITVYLTAFTKLREYIPGYTDPDLRNELYVLEERTDSLDHVLYQTLLFNQNLLAILRGEDTIYYNHILDKNKTKPDNHFEYKISANDSIFRNNFEQQAYSVNMAEANVNQLDISSFSFYPPVKGIITSKFNLAQHHIGTDIISTESNVVKATLDGIVILSAWTLETGNVIVIWHKHEFVSVYKHNSVLLKKEGEYVNAGEAIAITGNSGELSTGPHLHFELWYNNKPIDAEEVINFEN
jgi:murein DD-endopeptidase MepM/ murein hydrolase activator NlpD